MIRAIGGTCLILLLSAVAVGQSFEVASIRPHAGPLRRMEEWQLNVKGRNYEVTMVKATVNDIIQGINNSFVDRPVVDKTGLTGTYDLLLTYTPNTGANRGGDPDTSDASIFTAVQEQLGLKLEAQKAMIEVLVVDRARNLPRINLPGKSNRALRGNSVDFLD